MAEENGPVITREQQEQLDPVLGQAQMRFGPEAAGLVMAAYKIGRDHGQEVTRNG